MRVRARISLCRMCESVCLFHACCVCARARARRLCTYPCMYSYSCTNVVCVLVTCTHRHEHSHTIKELSYIAPMGEHHKYAKRAHLYTHNTHTHTHVRLPVKNKTKHVPRKQTHTHVPSQQKKKKPDITAKMCVSAAAVMTTSHEPARATLNCMPSLARASSRAF